MKRTMRKNPSSLLSLAAIAVIVGALVVWNQALSEPETTPEPQPAAYSISEAPPAQSEAPITESSAEPISEKTAAREEPPLAETSPAEASVSAAVTVENWLAPGNGQWSSGYGYRLDPTLGDYRFHSGADLDMAEGALVFSVAEGVISKIYTDEQWGQSLEISHPGQLTSIYHGVRASQVAEGDQVEAGATIGVLTASPPAEGQQKPHLHLELLDSNGPCDPRQFIK